MSDNTTTKIQYGLKHEGGNVNWADEDNDLVIPSKVGESNYVDADDLSAIRAAMADRERDAAGLTLVQRNVTTTAIVYSEAVPVPDPMPTAPGSVVRATRVFGRTVEMLLCRADDVNTPWRAMSSEAQGAWFDDAALTDVTVLFDASTVLVKVPAYAL